MTLSLHQFDVYRESILELFIQMPRLLDSAVDSVIDSAPTMNRREEDDGTRWEANSVSGVSLDELVPTSTVEHLQYCIPSTSVSSTHNATILIITLKKTLQF